MAKLLREMINFDDIEIIKEDVGEGENKQRHCYLQGPFLQAEVKNRNGRIYERTILEREVTEFVNQKIKTNRALGELDHPDSPQINLDRVSHRIVELKMDGATGIGKAKLIDTPMGRIAETLVLEGITVGMSTRGVGSLDGDKVKDDYKLITIDIVADPSAPNAFVEGVLENREFIVQGDEIVEVAVQNLKKAVDNEYSKKDISQQALRYIMTNFINTVKNNIK